MSKKITVRMVDATEGDNHKLRVVSGGNPNNPSWEDYLDEYTKTGIKRIKLIKECIIKNGHLGTKADKFCNYHEFLFSDGERWAFTWRGWGDLMQAIINKKEGYIQYYM